MISKQTLLSLLIFGIGTLTACSQSDNVAVVGGSDNNGSMLNSVDIYNPGTGLFTQSKSVMSVGRMTPTVTLLGNNTVLIAGGQSPAALNTAEIYQPISDTFVLLPNKMNHTRVAHTATLLNSAVVSGPLAGNVLITGGDMFSRAGTAELFNPTSGTFTNTGNMTTPRNQHTATLISHCGCAADGSVLVVGGYDNQSSVLSSVELYNPATQTFTQTGSLHTPRFRHTATLLNDGTILIAGGASQMSARAGNINPALNTAEIYNPKTGQFTVVRNTMTAYREAHAANLLKNGTVLLTGGQDNHFLIENTAEIYDPVAGTFTATSASCAGSPAPLGCMQVSRDFHISQTLDDGRVLLAGGVNSVFATLNSAEIYNPGTKTFTLTSNSMSAPRNGSASSLIITGR